MTTTSDARTAFTISPFGSRALRGSQPAPLQDQARPLQLFDDPELRASGPRVREHFLAGRADRLLGHELQASARRFFLEGPLHQTVFQRVEGDHGASGTA